MYTVTIYFKELLMKLPSLIDPSYGNNKIPINSFDYQMNWNEYLFNSLFWVFIKLKKKLYILRPRKPSNTKFVTNLWIFIYSVVILNLLYLITEKQLKFLNYDPNLQPNQRWFSASVKKSKYWFYYKSEKVNILSQRYFSFFLLALQL